MLTNKINSYLNNNDISINTTIESIDYNLQLDIHNNNNNNLGVNNDLNNNNTQNYEFLTNDVWELLKASTNDIFSIQLDDDYFCSCCEKILVNPKTAVPCEHGYCEGCINDILSSQEPLCVKDNNRIYQTIGNKQLAKIINNLEVKCPGFAFGCEWKGKLSSLEDHYTQGCRYKPIQCQLNCGKILIEKTLEYHLNNDCESRNVKCEFCQQQIKLSELKLHTEAICPQMEVLCPNNCKEICEDKDDYVIKRENLNLHMEICPLEKLKCPIETCKSVIPRSQMNKHIQDNIYFHFIALKEENKELKNKMDVYQSEISDNIKIQSDLFKEENQFIMHRIQKLTEHNAELENQLFLLKEENTNIKKLLQKTQEGNDFVYNNNQGSGNSNNKQVDEFDLNQLGDNANASNLINDVNNNGNVNNNINQGHNSNIGSESYEVPTKDIIWSLYMSSKHIEAPNSYEALVSDDVKQGAGTQEGQNQFIKCAFPESVIVKKITLAGAKGMSGVWDACYLNGCTMQYSIDDVNYNDLFVISRVLNKPKVIEIEPVKAKFFRIINNHNMPRKIGVGILKFE